MGSAIKNMRSGSRVPVGANRKRQWSSPLDKAKGYEVAWQAVAPIFEAARPIDKCSFVYFIGEADEGPVKIGVSKDPIARLRGMQTGNPRRLRIEQVLIGDAHIEKLLHEMWERHAIFSARNAGKVDSAPGTEWFESAARPELLPILATAAEFQAAYLATVEEGAVDLGELESCIRQAHGDHGFDVQKRDEIRFMAAGAGTVLGSRRSRL